jgi:hypothetical protein
MFTLQKEQRANLAHVGRRAHCGVQKLPEGSGNFRKTPRVNWDVREYKQRGFRTRPIASLPFGRDWNEVHAAGS